MTEYNKLEDFYNTKIELDTPEKVRKFQEKIFRLGGAWCSGKKKVHLLNRKYFYYDKTEGITIGINKNYFDKHHNKQIYYEDIFPEEQEFKKGDIVYLKGTKSTGNKWNEYFNHKVGMKCEIEYILNYGDLALCHNNENRGFFLPQDVSREPIEKLNITKTKEDNKMELKNMNEDNLIIAKQQFEEERANEEIRVAKAEYARLADRLDTLNREIKTREEEKKEIKDKMKLFDEKKKKK